MLDLAIASFTATQIGHPAPVVPFERPAPFAAPVGAAGLGRDSALRPCGDDGSSKRRRPLEWYDRRRVADLLWSGARECQVQYVDSPARPPLLQPRTRARYQTGCGVRAR